MIFALMLIAIALRLTRSLPVIENLLPFVQNYADLLAFLLMVLHGAIALTEDYRNVLSWVAIGGTILAFVQPQMAIVGVVVAIGCFLNYLYGQSTERSATIFVSCSVLANWMR